MIIYEHKHVYHLSLLGFPGSQKQKVSQKEDVFARDFLAWGLPYMFRNKK